MNVFWELILARTGDGRKRAKERGVRFGRPRKLTPHQRQEVLARLQAGETQADIARSYAGGRHHDRATGVKLAPTVHRLMKKKTRRTTLIHQGKRIASSGVKLRSSLSGS